MLVNTHKRKRRYLVGIIMSLILVLILGVPAIFAYADNDKKVTIDEVQITSSESISDHKVDGTHKVTFKLNSDTSKDYYLKDNATLSFSLVDNVASEKGIVTDYADNTPILDDTTVNIQTYKYADCIKLDKQLASEVPDDKGEYTLNFTAQSQNIPRILANNKTVLVLDISLSMGCGMDADPDSDDMADSYEETRWYSLKNTVENFVSNVLSKDSNHQFSIVTYAGKANVQKFNGNAFTSSKSDINNLLDGILSKNEFITAKIAGALDLLNFNSVDHLFYTNLDSGTNIDAGLTFAQSTLGDSIDGSSVVLVTDGITNHYLNNKGEVKEGKDNNYYVQEAENAGINLKNAGAKVYAIALMNNSVTSTKNYSYVKKSMGVNSYAKGRFYLASSASALSTAFTQIKVSTSDLPFETSTIVDELDPRFEVVSESDTDEKSKITLNYEKPISETPQTKSVKIRLKDAYKTDDDQRIAGSAFTNGTCQFIGKIDNKHSFTTMFAQHPTAIILNPQNDYYEVNMNTTLNCTSAFGVLTNDGSIVNDGEKIISLTVKLTDTNGDNNNYKLTLNQDGSFSFKPYTVNDFKVSYTAVLNVNGTVLEKTAEITFHVVPLETRTIHYKYEDGSTALADVVQTTYQGQQVDKVVSPVITGYQPDIEEVDKAKLDTSTEVTVTYKKDLNQKKTLSYTVKYYLEDTHVDTVTRENKDYWINDPQTMITVNAQDLNKEYEGYKLAYTEPKVVPKDVKDKTIISLYYSRDDSQTKTLTYTAEYYKDNQLIETLHRNIDVWVLSKDNTITVVDEDLNNKDKYLGYKLQSTNPEKIESKVASGSILQYYYVKDDSVTKTITYHVNYYKEDPNKTGTYNLAENIAVPKTVWINDPDTVKVDAIDTSNTRYEGYSYEKTDPSPIPGTVKDGDNINVYYKKDTNQTKTLTYYVEYFKNDVSVKKDTFLKNVWVGEANTITVDQSKINLKDMFTGYELDGDKTGTIPDTVDNGSVIPVYYKVAQYPYTINYLDKDTKKAIANSDTGMKNYNEKLEAVKKPIDNYNIVDGDYSIIIKPATGNDVNVINVYYTKDQNKRKTLSYTVNYYKGDVLAEHLSMTADVWAGDSDMINVDPTVINVNDKFEGYTFDSEKTKPIPSSIQNGGIIDIYYKVNQYGYVVNYYDKDNNILLDCLKGDPVNYGVSVTAPEKIFEHYTIIPDKYTLTIGVENNVINVYYSLNKYPYTIEYYYDGIQDKNKTENLEATFGAKINKYPDKVIEGYGLKSAPANLPMTITDQKNKNVIRVDYVKNKYTYRIEYYFDGVIDKDYTITATKEYAEIIKIEKEDKKPGFEFDHVDTPELKIGTDNEKNVIKAYYKRSMINYTYEYYLDNVINKDMTVTQSALFESKIIDNGYKKIPGYKNTQITGLPLTISADPLTNVIRLYYEKQSYKYTVEYYVDNEIQKDLTDTFVQPYGSKAEFYNQKVIKGTEFVKVENNGLVISDDETKNVIKVYYKKLPVPVISSDQEEVPTESLGDADPAAEVYVDEDSVKTGDSTPCVIYFVLLLMAAGSTIVVVSRKHRLQ